MGPEELHGIGQLGVVVARVEGMFCSVPSGCLPRSVSQPALGGSPVMRLSDVPAVTAVGSLVVATAVTTTAAATTTMATATSHLRLDTNPPTSPHSAVARETVQLGRASVYGPKDYADTNRPALEGAVLQSPTVFH